MNCQTQKTVKSGTIRLAVSLMLQCMACVSWNFHMKYTGFRLKFALQGVKCEMSKFRFIYFATFLLLFDIY